MTGKPILIAVADSDRFVLDILSKKLEGAGFKVIPATSAEELLALLIPDPPHLVITELLLSGTDGLSLIRGIARHPKLLGIPILVHSSCDRRDAILLAIRNGASSYIVKPASFHTILVKISQELEKRGVPMPAKAKIPKAPLAGRFAGKANSLQQTVQSADSLMALPQAVQKALQAAKDPKTDAADLAHIIESDTAITATILRKANTVVFGGADPILDVKDAIVRLGFRQAMGLVCAMSVVKNLQSAERSLGFNRLLFWEHSLATAVIAAELARPLQADASEVFIGGLLHDLGKMILDQCLPEAYEQCIEKAHRDCLSLAASMQDVLGFTHESVAQVLLQHWEFPEYLRLIVTEAAMQQDFSNAATSDWQQQGRIVQVANILAKAFGFGTGPGQLIDVLNDDMADRLQLSLEQSFVFHKRVSAELQTFKTYLGMNAGLRPELFDSNFSIKRIFIVDLCQHRINTLALYLEYCGFVVAVQPSLESMLPWLKEFSTSSLLILQASPTFRIDDIVGDLQDLPADMPVLFSGSVPQTSQWKRSHFNRKTEVAVAPMACSDVVHRINNLGET